MDAPSSRNSDTHHKWKNMGFRILFCSYQAINKIGGIIRWESSTLAQIEQTQEDRKETRERTYCRFHAECHIRAHARAFRFLLKISTPIYFKSDLRFL